MSVTELKKQLKEKEKEIVELRADNHTLYETVCTLNQTLNRMINTFI